MSYSYVSIKKAALNWVIRGESVYLRIKSVLPDIPYISNLSKMKKADLHVHSKYSNDGEFGIQDIIEMCELNGVGILSITDHNSVKGIKDALRLCEQSSLIFIPGIEIDCNYNGIDLHLLGYNINWRSKDFVDLEGIIRMKVMDSFPQMIENLAKSGITVDATEVLGKSEGKLPCGELIAEVLLTNKDYHSNQLLKPYLPGGARSDMPYINFYFDFFAQGKPAYVAINYISYDEAIDLVINNGGTAIIAHPGMNLKGREEIVNELIYKGAKGIEVFNNYHDVHQVEYFAKLAERRNILMTCGSDFHGKNKPLIKIGEYQVIEKYKDYLYKSILQFT